MMQRLFKPQTDMLSAAGVLMLTVFLSRILGLLRDRFLAGGFFTAETAGQLDVYFAAFRLPDMIFQLLAVGAFSAAFIPVFSHYLIKDEKEAWQVASGVISFGLFLFLLLGGFLAVFSAPLSHLIAPNFTGEQLALMTSLTKMLLLAQGFFLISNFLTGVLQSHHYFLVPALAPIAYNLGIIGGILVLGPRWGIYGPASGVVLGAALHFLIQVPSIKRLGFNFRFNLNWRHPGVRRVGRLMLPRTLALAVGQIELTMAVFLASSLPMGSLAIFYFAQNLNNLPVGLFGATIGQAALPTLAKNVSSESLDKFKALLLSSLNQALYLSLPAGMILLILRIPAVRLAFGAKGFPWEATILTGKVVALLAISVFAQSAIQILVRGFYALANTKTPLYLAAAAVAVNVVLSLWFIYGLDFGVLGLALGISLSSFFHCGLLLVFLGRLTGGFDRHLLLWPFVKMAAATGVTGFALWGPLRVLDRYILNTAKTLDLIVLSVITVVIGLGVYGGLSKLLKIKELDSFTVLLKRFSRQPAIEPLPEI